MLILTTEHLFFMGMPIFFNLLLKRIRYILVKFCISTAVLLITPTLWDWSLARCGPFFISFLQLMDFILSAMENLPLSIGGGGSGAGPSQRPLIDLNLSPAPEPEPALPSELSEEEKEVIQPHLPVRLPCYDFTPVTSPALPSLSIYPRDGRAEAFGIPSSQELGLTITNQYASLMPFFVHGSIILS